MNALVTERAKQLLLEAFESTFKHVVIENSDESINADAISWCIQNNWFVQDSDKNLLRLTAQGKEVATQINRDKVELATSEAMQKILLKAVQNQGRIIWDQKNRTLLTSSGRLHSNSKEQTILNEAAWRLVNEKQWLQNEHESTFRITEIGRMALNSESRHFGVMEKQTKLMANVDYKRVFVVHGRDEAARLAVQNFLLKLNLTPTILFEELNKGRTIIEKFEQEAEPAAFAIVLLTPDDEGGVKSTQWCATLPRQSSAKCCL